MPLMIEFPVPTVFTPLEDVVVEFVEEKAGIYFRSVLLAKAGTVIPQHVHDHDHATFVGSGSVRLWVDGEWAGDVKAGHAIEIKAGREHLFQSLADNTLLACIHDVASATSIKEKGI
jgi:quercetin dioxygenase-like cupin family protein